LIVVVFQAVQTPTTLAILVLEVVVCRVIAAPQVLLSTAERNVSVFVQFLGFIVFALL
jgi:hypothetical protein